MRICCCQLLLAMLGIACLQACQSKSNAERTEKLAPIATATYAPAVAPSQALAKRFGPIIRGAWVNANYLAVIRQTKSPLMAFDSTGYISEMIIDPATIRGDSLAAGVGYGNHEGGDVTIYLRLGRHANTLFTNHHEYDSPGSYAELGYQLSSLDTTLVLTTFSKNQKILARASYHRIRNGSLDQLNNLDLAVNQMLIAGYYTGVDSLQRPVHLQFTTDGQIVGWPGIRTYSVNTDFGAGPGNEIDHLIVEDSKKHKQLLYFQFRADTLHLYRAAMVTTTTHAGTDDETVSERLTQGKLLFTLTRR